MQYIGKMHFAGPYCCCERFTVFPFAEISVCHSFFINRIALFDFHPCINNRNQMNMLFFHFTDKFRKVGKCLSVNRKVLKMIHIIDIHIDTVKRNIIFSVLFYDLSYICSVLISPTALSETKSPFWRNIASADQSPKFMHDL